MLDKFFGIVSIAKKNLKGNKLLVVGWRRLLPQSRYYDERRRIFGSFRYTYDQINKAINISWLSDERRWPAEKLNYMLWISFCFSLNFLWIKKARQTHCPQLVSQALKLQISYEVIKWMFGPGHLSVFLSLFLLR